MNDQNQTIDDALIQPGEAPCFICGSIGRRDEACWFGHVCFRCSHRYPHSLLKACVDTFGYMIGLRNGDVFEFHDATITGKFVHLNVMQRPSIDQPIGQRLVTVGTDRGVDVRIKDIVWCVDAPYGS